MTSPIQPNRTVPKPSTANAAPMAAVADSMQKSVAASTAAADASPASTVAEGPDRPGPLRLNPEAAARLKLSELEQKIRKVEAERAALLASTALDTLAIEANARKSGAIIKQYNDARRALLAKLKKSQQKLGQDIAKAIASQLDLETLALMCSHIKEGNLANAGTMLIDADKQK